MEMELEVVPDGQKDTKEELEDQPEMCQILGSLVHQEEEDHCQFWDGMTLLIVYNMELRRDKTCAYVTNKANC